MNKTVVEKEEKNLGKTVVKIIQETVRKKRSLHKSIHRS